MSAGVATAFGQAAAEQRMADTCTIARESVTFTNPDTGGQILASVPIYAGKCRVQNPGGASPTQPGETHLLLLSLTVHVPVSATGIKPGDIVTITGAAHDPELVGRRFRVKDLFHKTHPTSRRLGVQEVT